MQSDKKVVQPYSIYNVDETAELIGMNPVVLRRKLQEVNRSNEPFIVKSNPQKIGKEWRFLGENILYALGSVTIQPQSLQVKDVSGVAPTNQEEVKNGY